MPHCSGLSCDANLLPAIHEDFRFDDGTSPASWHSEPTPARTKRLRFAQPLPRLSGVGVIEVSDRRFRERLQNIAMPCCHFLSPTIASRSMSPKCLMSNLISSHSAPASQPWKPSPVTSFQRSEFRNPGIDEEHVDFAQLLGNRGKKPLAVIAF